MPKRRIALIHDWLTGMRGGEKVLEVLCELFPEADLFTLVHVKGSVSPVIENRKIVTSPLQRIPGIAKRYRHFLPLMPWAIEQLDFKGYDLLISTSHCAAKASIPPPGVPHWSYCHTPMRYIWDQFDDYFGPGRSSVLARGVMTALRPSLQRWDVRTASRVTHFLANSENVRERIQRIYHRDSQVIYPPVDVQFFSAPSGDRPIPEPYYLIVSAFAPYKRLDIALQALRLLGKRVLVIGDGQDASRLQALAGPTASFLGWRENAELRAYFAHAEALLFPGVEDFGIVPLEAMAAGAPVIAYRKGGALETVKEGVTGLFFDAQTPEAMAAAIEKREKMRFDPAAVLAHARRFSREACKESFRRTFVEYQQEMS